MAVPALLSVASFLLAFAQRTGLATADTKINLHVDPGRFLADVASMWTSTGQLGGVQSGQQAGYLFPMGPFFALGHALGLPDWVLQRLWLGLLLSLAAWGVVRLLDALHPAPRGIVHLAAGAVTILNPFVVTYTNRTTVTLLAYAALPWLLLAVHRGLRDSRGWRWPAACALLATAAGGGVNGAVVAWMLVGPALLVVYEAAFAGVGFSAARSFLVRVVPLGVLVSTWWIIPAYVQSKYGVDFLKFTEQPGTVWGTTSATESLRLMGFWLSYVGIGFAGRAIPYFDDSGTLLFSLPVVVGTLLLPASGLVSFAAARRWRYGPFFLALVLAGVLIMLAGFPEGTPLRHGLTFTYNHVAAVRFLRASYKAAPLVAIGLACLCGAGAGALSVRLGGAARVAALGAGAVVLALAAWPLVTGRAQDRQVSFKRIPTAWRQVATDLDRGLPANARAIVLPGELFSFYTWGGTVDPILPALSRRPVAERTEVPYSDLRATDLLWTIDGLVHQGRLLPGQLAPLLQLIGVRSVITGTDSDLARSDAPAPAAVAATLSAQPGFGEPTRSYGPVRRFGAVSLPQVRRYDLGSARGVVHVEPQQAPIVVDGSAAGIAGLAAFGGLPSGRAVQYAADLSPGALRAAVASGGEVVITDSNRRRAFVAGSLEQNVGATLPADQTVSADGFILDPFGRGPDFETVATYSGIRSVSAPFSPQTRQDPSHRPFAALDGSPATAWLADQSLDPGRWYLDVALTRPTDVPYVDLLPYGGVHAVSLGGRSYAVHPGWNHLAVGDRGDTALRVSVSGAGAPLGIRELRIPGVRATEQMRPPVDAARTLRGADLGRVTLTYLFERTADDTLGMRRVFEVPSARSFAAAAWVSPAAAGQGLPRGCGAVRVLIDGRVVRLRVSGGVGGPGRSGPLPAVPCGRPVALAAGSHLLSVPLGAYRVDAFALRSAVRSRAPAATGHVVNAGTFGRGSHNGVRVSVTGPSWLVLGEGYDRGWQASCDGHSLGAPVPIDGYANGWKIGPSCHSVSFTFSPNRLALIGYIVSGVAGLVCLALVAWPLLAWPLRRRRSAAAGPDPESATELPAADHPRRLTAVHALAWAVAAGLVFGFVFGVRAGAVAVPVLALILWRGIGPRPLTLAAGALLGIVVPLLYIIDAPSSVGGNHYGYATDHMTAHWAAVAAIGLLFVALWRTLAGVRKVSAG
jgi:arabinofuranan 3-O-arabinosyltransferase